MAVVERNGQYLITQRMPQDSFGGFWEFPGGKLHDQETLEACLIREIREELGIVVAVEEKLLVVEHPYPSRMIRLHCFRCALVEGEPRTLECSAWRWVVAGELTQFEFPPASRSIIELLQKKKDSMP